MTTALDTRSAAVRVHVPAWLRCLGALLGALVVIAILVALLGASPLATLRALLSAALGTPFGIGQTIVIASVIALTGLAALVPFSARLWNIGGEGQMYMGALAAAGLGIVLPEDLPGVVLVSVCVAGAIAGGALWGLIPGLLKAAYDTSEIVVSLMLNFVAILAATFAITSVWPQGFAPQTEYVATGALLPTIWAPGVVNAGVLLALAAIAFAWLMLARTGLGFRIKALGANRDAARLAGVRTSRVTVLAFLFGGGFAGLAGAISVLGVNGALVSGFSGNFGFIGIAVALLARLAPAWVLPSALFLAVMRVGSNSLQASTGLAPSIGEVLVAILIVLLMVGGVIRFRYTEPSP